MGLVIREERSADIGAVRDVEMAAFGRLAEADLVDALRKSGGLSLSLVAEDDGNVVGHIAFSPLTIEEGGRAVPAVALAPMAVLPSCQNEGIGTLLVNWGLNACRDAGHKVAVVLGHAGYYPRFGFAPASSFGIKCPFPAPDEAFMVLELEEGALSGVSGTVRYRPEFGGG